MQVDYAIFSINIILAVIYQSVIYILSIKKYFFSYKIENIMPNCIIGLFISIDIHD